MEKQVTQWLKTKTKQSEQLCTSDARRLIASRCFYQASDGTLCVRPIAAGSLPYPDSHGLPTLLSSDAFRALAALRELVAAGVLSGLAFHDRGANIQELQQ